MQGYDIIFLDIEMPSINGIELAHKIREKSNALLFYVTSYASLVTRAINGFAFTFIPKPISEEDLFLELDRAKVELSMRKGFIQVSTQSGTRNISPNEIVFIEVNGKQCEIHQIDGKSVTTKTRLYKIKEKLS